MKFHFGSSYDLEICIGVMQIGYMERELKSATPGITVRLPATMRKRIDDLARMERRSAAAYIEGLVERDLRERDEADRVIDRRVADGLPDKPAGRVTRGEQETDEAYRERAALLDAMFGA